MVTGTHVTVGGVFESRDRAIQAIEKLQHAGFAKDDLGIVGRNAETGKIAHPPADEAAPGEGGIAGAAVGASVGALVGWAVLSGAIPVVGPAVAAGSLGTILSNAVAGAAMAGLAGSLIGMGFSQVDVDFYESELRAGRTLVTVEAGGRVADAVRIFEENGGRTKPPLESRL